MCFQLQNENDNLIMEPAFGKKTNNTKPKQNKTKQHKTKKLNLNWTFWKASIDKHYLGVVTVVF